MTKKNTEQPIEVGTAKVEETLGADSEIITSNEKKKYENDAHFIYSTLKHSNNIKVCHLYALEEYLKEKERIKEVQ